MTGSHLAAVDAALALEPLLADLREHFPTVVLAGGYLRDAYLGHKPKDIDIFLYGNNDASMGFFFERMDQTYDIETDDFTHIYPHYAGGDVGRELNGVAEIAAANFEDLVPDDALPLPIQFIIMRNQFDTDGLIRSFDIGLCQIGWSGTFIHTTPAFSQDVLGNTMTVTRRRTAKCYDRTCRRLHKFNTRYSSPDSSWSPRTIVDLKTGDPLKFAIDLTWKDIPNDRAGDHGEDGDVH